MLPQQLPLFCAYIHAAASLETQETFTEHKSNSEDSCLFLVLKRVKSNETDLKITSHKIIPIFFHVLSSSIWTTDRTFSGCFSAKRVQLKSQKEGWNHFQEVRPAGKL